MFFDAPFCFFQPKTAYEMRISDWSSDVCSSDLQLEFQQPVLINQRTTIDIAAAQHGGDAGGDFHVVLGNEAAFEHVDQHHLEGGDADIAGHRDLPRRDRQSVV